jgi:hypothetical protein
VSGSICFAGVMVVGTLAYIAGWREAAGRGTALLVKLIIAGALAVIAPVITRDLSCLTIELLVMLVAGFAGWFDQRR